MKNRTLIIAEAGVNHNGSLEQAKFLIDIAANAGADIVKFQTFQAEKLASKFAEKAEYQEINDTRSESQLEMLRRLQLSPQAHFELMQYCIDKKIQFLSTPFDLESIDFLKTLKLAYWKIPSGEITNLPYLRKIGEQQGKVILSSGMSTLREIESALIALENAGTKKSDITVLHCNTEYPTPYEDVNLNAMISIKETLKVKIGYSDHTLGIEVAVAAVALGAEIIEKHFTIDKLSAGPDHKASLSPEELLAMVKAIRHIEAAMGSDIKKPSPSEIKNTSIARKSIVAAKPIKIGEIFTTHNITTKRPGNGISPMQWDELLGKSSTRLYNEDDLINEVI